MKIEFVAPAVEDSAFLKNLAIATLAGLTPKDVEVAFKDDVIARLDPSTDLDFSVDLAAITASSKTVARAYELAAAYRAHGVKVVMGGIHPTALPGEVSEHCDAVVVGEAEGLWERVVDDARRGTLSRLYRNDSLVDFRTPSHPRRDIFKSKKYVPVDIVQASRGCPFDCDFCSVTQFFGRRFRLRDVPDTVDEVRGLAGHWVMFADDNIVGIPAHSLRLFEALKPLRVTWFGQGSLHGLSKEATVKQLAASGCKALFIGFESVSPASLKGCGKNQNNPAKYIDSVRMLQDNGIAVWASFVLGLDEDDEGIFDGTLDFALRAPLFMASFAMLTPYPGTRLYDRLKGEGRLRQDRWWLQTNRDDSPLYRPKRMSADKLYEGWQRVWREFYSRRSILSRFYGSSFSSFWTALTYLPLNLKQRRLTTEKILGGKKHFLRDRS